MNKKLIIGIALLLSFSLVEALDCGNNIPELPHVFYGYAKYGSNVLQSKTVVATLGGNEFSTITDLNGYYYLNAWRCSNDTSSLITFEVYTKDANETSIYSPSGVTYLNLTIDLTPPDITIIYPQNDSVIKTNYTWINLTTSESSYCYKSDMYNYDVGDITPPQPYNGSPTGSISVFCNVNLEFYTDERSICKGSVNEDKSYDNMDIPFDWTKQGLVYRYYYNNYNIDGTGDYTLFVKCKDMAGNLMTNSYNWDFEVYDYSCGPSGGGGGGGGFNGSYNLTHQFYYDNLTDDNVYWYEFTCKDQSYNANSKWITFLVNISIWEDSDGDNVTDNEDACPTTYGEWCNGCPEPDCVQCTLSSCPEDGVPYCQNLALNIICDLDYRCSAGIGDNNYEVGGDYLCRGYCDGQGSCDYANKCYYTDVCDADYDKTQDYVNLNRFPKPFVKFGKFNGSIILGDNSSPYDVLATTEIGIILQYSMQNSLSYLLANNSIKDITSYRKIPTGNVILASEFNNTNDNLIIIGEPCSNDLLFTFLNITKEMCDDFILNKSIMKLFNDNDRAVLLVIGYTPINTLQAAVALANYEEYNLQGDELVITMNEIITPTCNNNYNCDYDETFFSCPDDCTHGDEDNDEYNSLIDCNDTNASIYPGALELCNGIDDDCDDIINEGFPDLDKDGTADCIDPDDDNDGINDDIDPLIGNSNSINSTTITPVVEIDDSTNLGQAFSGVKNVLIKDGTKIIVEFQFNFSKDKINLYNVTINKQEGNTTGSIIIKGISLPEGETKTVYIDDLSTTNTLCIEDQQIASISEISSNCDGTGEVPITCNGTSGNYNCTDLGDRYKITGLQHSGVKEYTYIAPLSGGLGGGGGGGGGTTERVCIEAWACTDWTPPVCPVTRQQTRTCTDGNNCGTIANKPNEVRTCYYAGSVALEEEKEEAAKVVKEEPTAVALPEEAPIPTQSMIAITGAAIGTAYQERPATMWILTLFILLIIGLFVYSHARNLKHWPFHFKHQRKWLVVLVIIIFILFILLFIHFVLLAYFR